MYQDITIAKSRVSNHKSSRVLFLVVLTLITVGSLANYAAAADAKAQPQITLAQLKGPWAVTLYGQTGCGVGTVLVTFTLDATGNGTSTQMGHTVGCGDFTTPGLPFTVTSLNANGSGTANLSCGSGCGVNFVIQVSKNHQVFSLVDVTDGGNFLQGVAVHQ